MPERARDSGKGKAGGPSSSGSFDEKKIRVEFTRSFDEQFSRLSEKIQEKSKQTVVTFIDCYLTRQFPKSLRVHKCGPFVSLSIRMDYRIFLLPIPGGIKFVFIGDHATADRYLKRA